MTHLADVYDTAKPFGGSDGDAAARSAVAQWLFWVNAGLGPMAGQARAPCCQGGRCGRSCDCRPCDCRHGWHASLSRLTISLTASPPSAAQLSHFTYYAPQIAPEGDHSYAHERYRREYERLIGVMERRLGVSGGFLAGKEWV